VALPIVPMCDSYASDLGGDCRENDKQA